MLFRYIVFIFVLMTVKSRIRKCTLNVLYIWVFLQFCKYLKIVHTKCTKTMRFLKQNSNQTSRSSSFWHCTFKDLRTFSEIWVTVTFLKRKTYFIDLLAATPLSSRAWIQSGREGLEKSFVPEKNSLKPSQNLYFSLFLMENPIISVVIEILSFRQKNYLLFTIGYQWYRIILQKFEQGHKFFNISASHNN